MNFLKLIRSEINIVPLLEEIMGQEQAWQINTSRQDKINVQGDTNSIFISRAVRRPDLKANENQESEFTKISQLFPRAVEFMTSIAAEMNASLSRATIIRLKPHSKVSSHIDKGSYYLIRDRYHLVLNSPKGSMMLCGDEKVYMQPGELWWFNNKQYHEAANESDGWRIHYIFDLLPDAYRHMAVNAAYLPVRETTNTKSSNGDEAVASLASTFLMKAIRDCAILRGKDQRLISRKGSPNSWMIDMRRIFMNGGVLKATADLFLEKCFDLMPFQIGAVETAAIPMLAAILMRSMERGVLINGFILRKERKTYGTGSLIEGVVTDLPIIVIDDIFSSGESLEKVRAVLEYEHKKIDMVFAVVDFHSTKGIAWRNKHRIPVRSAFSASDFGLSFRRHEEPLLRTVFSNVWRFASPDPNFFHRVPKSFPVNDGKRVYFGSDSGFFWCLDARNGAVVWNFKVDSKGHKNIWSSPSIYNGKVFFGSYDGNVYCLDAESGIEIWRFTEADWVGSSPALAPDLGLLFIGLEFATEGKKGSIVALNLESGEKVWEYITKRYTHASPAYWQERQLVACGSNDNELFLFDARTGVVSWRFETKSIRGEKASIRHAPAFDAKRGSVITGCANGRIYVIGVENGKEAWSVQTDNTIYTIPLVIEDTAYIGSTDKYLYVLDLDKRVVKAKIYAGSKIFGPPRLLDGRVYFGACNGTIFEIDPATVRITGRHQLPDAITNALSFNCETNQFYALTYMNQLFAFTRASDQ
jgi:outer membrane protein assembly factor BamB/orotate phosphoribosyltransferase